MQQPRQRGRPRGSLSSRSTPVPAPAPASAPALTSTRTTRQSAKAKAPSEAGSRTSRASRRAQSTQPAQGPVTSRLLGSGGPARRGAPKNPDDASIVISRQADSDSDEDDEEEEEGGEAPEESEEIAKEINVDHGSLPRPADDSLAISEFGQGQHDAGEAIPEEVRLQIMASSLSDLNRASRELIQLLVKPEQDVVSRVHLRVKRKAFLSTRELYEDESESSPFPFLDSGWINQTDDETETELPAPEVTVIANIATALEIIDRYPKLITKDENLRFLEKLSDIAFFPKLFTHNTHADQNTQLLLDIRTSYFIELMGEPERSNQTYETIASIFCSVSSQPSDFPRLVREGPFQSLGSEDEEHEKGMCIARIGEILQIVTPQKIIGKPELKAKTLRAKFPLRTLYKDIRQWMLMAYASAGSPKRQRAKSVELDGDEGSMFFPGEEEDADSGTDSESQPIVRVAPGENMQSLYANPASLDFLQKQGSSNTDVPPSNQQQTKAEVPPTRSAPGSQGQANPPSQVIEIGDESASESEEDPFQFDERFNERAPKPTKRPAETRSSQPAKRSRLDPNPSAPVSSAVGSMGPPPIPNRQPSGAPPSSSAPPSSAPFPDIEASQEALKIIRAEKIRRNKLAIRQPRFSSSSQPSQASQPPPSSWPEYSRPEHAFAAQKRYTWSNRDCAVLIELVCKHRGCWADIERYENNMFEHPRHQQAYRDKARNLKVDYLLTDTVLPPAFDCVALSKKEIVRLIDRGKNPWRKEHDVDSRGNAINTAYVS